jgi:hypothetical protein
MGQDRERAFRALNELAHVISKPKSRSAFVANPAAALGEHWAYIPANVKRKLRQLSPEELQRLAELRATMIKAGLTVEAPGDYIACVL